MFVLLFAQRTAATVAVYEAVRQSCYIYAKSARDDILTQYANAQMELAFNQKTIPIRRCFRSYTPEEARKKIALLQKQTELFAKLPSLFGKLPTY